MPKSIVAGLHACGDLTAYGMGMFLGCESALACCFVPCCYHQIRERFATDEMSENCDSGFCGFPLSDYLVQKKIKLGKNARMLALQAMERLSCTSSHATEALYWRALLQKILLDKGLLSSNMEFLGKLGKKSKSFNEYCINAQRKMKLDWDVTESEILEYEESFKTQRCQLNLFCQLRYCLSPVLESIIILDRVLHLLEQENVGSVSVVSIFDPVKSPRYYSIVGLKK